MRIAMMPSAYAPAIGGVEELTRQLSLSLIGEGHEVEVWTHRHPEDLPRVEVIGGVTVRRTLMPLPAMSARGLVAFAPGAARAVTELRAQVRAFRPDLLHVQCFSGNGIYASIVSKLTGTPLVVTLQGETVMDDTDIYDHSSTLRLGLRAGLRAAAAVSGCSAYVLEDAMARFGLARGRGLVVPNGVDIDRDRSELTPVKLPFERFILGLGRVVHKKGFDLLLDAFAPVSAADPEVGLVIAGRGDALAELERRALELGLSGRVHFPGPFSRGEVAWAMANAELFVMPSRVEPFGIVTLEALASGRAAIVSSRGGAGEIVHDGVEGLVVDPLDSAALSEAISRLLGDAGLRTRMGEAGRERARRYAWPQITQEYLRLYEAARPKV